MIGSYIENPENLNKWRKIVIPTVKKRNENKISVNK